MQQTAGSARRMGRGHVHLEARGNVDQDRVRGRARARGKCRVGTRLRVGVGVIGSGLGFRIVLGCKMDKIFLRAPLVPMERRTPSAPMDS